MSDSDFNVNDYFIESPIFDNWFRRHYPERSLVICSPYMKKSAVDKIISLYNLGGRPDSFELKVLLRGNADEFTYHKSSDISVFDSLTALGCADSSNIRRIGNLHMKAYLIDGRHLLITSGNMTNSGMFVISGRENFEGGLSVNNPSVIDGFLRYFSRIWRQSQALDDFYDELMGAYTAYIGSGYSDRNTMRHLVRQRYRFGSRTVFEPAAAVEDEPEAPDRETVSIDRVINLFAEEQTSPEEEAGGTQTFTLSDIPPNGRLEHLPDTLRIIRESPGGISYIELGRRLREIFGDGVSERDDANRKFGEEKGKFAAYFGFASVEGAGRSMLFKITRLGNAYLEMNGADRSKLVKDIFFDKPIIVSILRHSMEQEGFNLLEFLSENCEGAPTTLARKVGPLKELFGLVQSLCTDEELKKALSVN